MYKIVLLLMIILAASNMKKTPFVVLLLLLMASYSWASRWSIRETFIVDLANNSSSSSSSSSSSYSYFSVLKPSLKSTTVTCESDYGFLPCTTEVWGQLFLIVVYEYMLMLAQQYVSSGSNLFFQMFGSGILGASVFQILGTIPQVAILLVNGILGSTDTAEGLTSMGLAMLAGSTVMSLTLVWGAIVAFGSYDISKSQTSSTSEASTSDASTPLIADSSTSSTVNSFSLTGFGVTTDEGTTWIARIMLVSMIPFMILQLPQILNSSSSTRIAILIAIIISITFWLAYCIYQIFQPWIQDKRLEYILLKFVRDRLLDSLIDPYGFPDESSIKELFAGIDKNKSGTVTKAELEAFFFGIQLKEVGLDVADYVAMIIKQFDISGDAGINESEFVKGMKGIIQQVNSSTSSKKTRKQQKASSSTSVEQQNQSSTSTSTSTDKTWLNYLKAFSLLIIGTAISALLAQPLMENIQDFASAINIPSFTISYVVVPLAMSFKPAITSIESATQKTENAISVTLSATYNGVFTNGMTSLTAFLLIYYIRDLTWNVSAGMLVVLIVGLVMGFLTSFSTKFPFWTCIVAFLLYPISIGLIYVLMTYFGWS